MTSCLPASLPAVTAFPGCCTHICSHTWDIPCAIQTNPLPLSESTTVAQNGAHSLQEGAECPREGNKPLHWSCDGTGAPWLAQGWQLAAVPCPRGWRYLRVWRAGEAAWGWANTSNWSGGSEFLKCSPDSCRSSKFLMQPPSPGGHLSCTTPIAGRKVPQRSGHCCGSCWWQWGEPGSHGGSPRAR